MKKIFYLMFLVLLAFSCSKPREVDQIFGDPDKRVADTLAYVKSTLVKAPFGWRAYLSTEYSGGYGFYMQFQENDRLKMVADLDEETSSELKESTYRIRQIMYATLSFDTYNYLTMLQDPNPDVFGGQPGKGMGSDVEFDYIKTHGDTLFFEGRKFKKALVLVKAKESEAKVYTSKGYAQAIEKINKFFVENSNPYIEENGQKYQITVNNASKEAGATTILAGNKVESSSAKFYYTLDGIGCNAESPLKAGKVNIVKIAWENDKLIAYGADGRKFEVKNSVQPLIPLHLLMGTKYSKLYLPFNTLLPENSPKGTDILNRYFKGLGSGATGYVFNCGDISLAWNLANKRISFIGLASQNNCGSGWATTIVYDYTIDDATGVLKLTKRSSASGGYSAKIMDQLDDFLLNSSFKLEYVIDGKNLYAKIIGIDRPDVSMTFTLQ